MLISGYKVNQTKQQEEEEEKEKENGSSQNWHGLRPAAKNQTSNTINKNSAYVLVIGTYKYYKIHVYLCIRYVNSFLDFSQKTVILQLVPI